MFRVTSLTYLWAFVWTSGLQTEADGTLVQNLAGDVRLIGSSGEFHDCPYSSLGEADCFPYIFRALRENDTIHACNDIYQNTNREFRSEIVTCDYNQEGGRYECRLVLLPNDRVIYIGLKLTSSGNIANYTDLHCQYRRASNSTGYPVAVLHSYGGRRLDERPNHLYPFSVGVMCNEMRGMTQVDHCNIRTLTLSALMYTCS